MAHGSTDKPFSEPSTPDNGEHSAQEEMATSRARQSAKILHINVRSLKNKIDELEAVLVDKDFHDICVTEHWLRAEEIFVPQLKGYRIANYFTITSSNGGGAAIFVKDTLHIEILKLDNIKGYLRRTGMRFVIYQ